MAFSELREVQIHQVQANVALMNVYHVETLAGGTLADVANAAFVSVVQTLIPQQHMRHTYNRIVVKNLANLVEVHEEELQGITGTKVGVETLDLGPWLAIPIRLNRTTTAVRHGQKRFCGFQEDQITTRSTLEGPILAYLQGTFIPALLGDWGAGVCRLFVVKRILDGSFYRLPQNAGEYQSYHPTTATPRRLTSQRSRRQ